MNKKKGQFPDGLDYATVPDHYYYGEILVKRIDRGNGMIELVARDKNHSRHSVLARDLREAMMKMRIELKREAK
ncbi:hypothetical protein G3570_06660 [Balneolaceae bacterium YR4-1]|uniref:Uncharacterized protein n=1 Tax=Halalkalibaculum roseum TaxID=2709311 RepID=A0A6M1SW28_9BACT|nr:hypothetical protein [Halalkalibaculum roseum]NGP76306.1 hypothetical protein [Halalkalibaculum roseum]